MFNREQLCKEIGDFFGVYFEMNGKFCIDNGEKVFQYDTPEALLTDWVTTLVMHQQAVEGDPSGNWEAEIQFIYREIIRKPPTGVAMVSGKKGVRWKAYLDVSNGTLHGKTLHLGTYESIVDAISAREYMVLQRENGLSLDELSREADRLAEAASEDRKESKAPRCPHCGEVIRK